MSSSKSMSYLAIGSVGTGFYESSLERGLAMKPDFIGADSGSTDGGPNALAGIAPGWPEISFYRDLSLLIKGAVTAGIPLLVGSCGTSGRDWAVDWFADMARRAAKEFGLSFTVAKVYSEIGADLVVEKMAQGKVHPLDPAPPYDEAAVRRSTRITGVMGTEPFLAALDAGADVVLAGRATDTAIFAAIPLSKGFDPGVAWHAGKIAECGSGAAEPRTRLDVLHLRLDEESFVVSPLRDDIRCTPFSVSSKQLHEVADPFTMVEPGWTTDLTNVTYAAETNSTVRVTGATAVRTPHTVKLEGVERAGSQRMFMFSVRDPTILENLDAWIAGIDEDIVSRCDELIGPGGYDRCTVTTRIYGRDGTMGEREPIRSFEGHEAFLLVDVIADDETICETATSVIWYAFMHAKSPGWRGGGTVAWPFSQSIHKLGDVYTFNVHHVIEVDDPMETFRLELEEVAG
jgi:hypothetical protein